MCAFGMDGDQPEPKDANSSDDDSASDDQRSLPENGGGEGTLESHSKRRPAQATGATTAPAKGATGLGGSSSAGPA